MSANTLRSQESRFVAKKNVSLKLRLGGGPLKTRYAPLFHHLSFPVLLFQHSWRAFSLTSLSFHSPSTYESHFPTQISWASLEYQVRRTFASKASSLRVHGYSCHPWCWSPAPCSTVAFIQGHGSCQTRPGSLWSGLRWQGCVVPAPQVSSVTTGRIWQGHSGLMSSSLPIWLGVGNTAKDYQGPQAEAQIAPRV